MKTRASLVSLSLLAVAVASCDVSNSPPLPEGYNQAITRAFTVRLDAPVEGADGKPLYVRAFNGLDGSPLVPQDYGPVTFSQRAGVKLLRFPKGWGCQMTLDAIFPDAANDPSKSASYQIGPLQNTAVEMVLRDILPMWQTIYDVGPDACTSIDGVGKGTARIGDVDTWARVVAGVTERLSNATAPYFEPPRFSAKKMARMEAMHLRPGYVEFLPDALATANYAKGGIASLLPVYVAWRRAFDAVFTEGGATRIQALVAPSLPAVGAEDATTPGRPLKDFLDYVSPQKSLAPEVFSFLSNTSSPEAHLALVRAARQALDGIELTAVQVADTGLRLSDDAWKSLATLYDTRARRSAYLAAFLTTVKILEQDELDLLVVDRWGGPRAMESSIAGEDLFQSDDAVPLPALLALEPFDRMDDVEATRVQVSEVPWPAANSADVRGALASDTGSDAGSDATASDAVDEDVPASGELPLEGDPVRVLAARSNTGGMAAVVVALPRAMPARAGVRMRYQLDVEGVPPTSARWVLQRYHVDATTVGFRGPVESSAVVPDAEGHVRIVRDITGPAVDYMELVPEQAPK